MAKDFKVEELVMCKGGCGIEGFCPHGRKAHKQTEDCKETYGDCKCEEYKEVQFKIKSEFEGGFDPAQEGGDATTIMEAGKEIGFRDWMLKQRTELGLPSPWMTTEQTKQSLEGHWKFEQGTSMYDNLQKILQSVSPTISFMHNGQVKINETEMPGVFIASFSVHRDPNAQTEMEIKLVFSDKTEFRQTPEGITIQGKQ